MPKSVRARAGGYISSVLGECRQHSQHRNVVDASKRSLAIVWCSVLFIVKIAGGIAAQGWYNRRSEDGIWGDLTLTGDPSTVARITRGAGYG